MAHRATDVAVMLQEDRPGSLARAISAIGDAGINVDGYAEIDGAVHVLATDVQAVRAALEGAGFQLVTERAVVLAPVEDEPGAAGRIFQRIAAAKVNVRYSYLATRNRLVIGASDLQAILDALEK